MEISAVQATTECQPENDFDDDKPRQSALNNSLILHVIFLHLDTYHVKEVRLVCKAWENAGSSILGKRCRLPLHHLFPPGDITDNQLPVNPKFLQRIDITCPASNGNVTLRFNSIVSKWHTIVRDINVDIKDIRVGLPSTLNAYSFPNLTSMTIKTVQGYDFDDFNVPLRNIDTLTDLKIIGNFRRANDYSLLQSLINCATNLVVLQVQGNFYPSLASCHNLKVVKWIGYYGFDRIGSPGEARRLFDQDELLRILEEVGDRLEHLTVQLLICGFDYNRYSRTNETFNIFPNMPKLKKITVCPFDFLRIMKQICPSKFPNLKDVSFQHRDWAYLKVNLPDKAHHIHEGVTSLELIGVYEADQILVFSKKYPNVNRIVLTIISDCRSPKIDNEGDIRTILQACSTWKLSYLEIAVDIQCEFKLSELFKGLTYLGVLKGLLEVKIRILHGIINDIHNDFEAFKQVLQLGGKMKKMTFIGLALKLSTAKKVLMYLEQFKDLPVYYLD